MNSPERSGSFEDDVSSPDIFSSNVRCNLETRYTITLGRNSVKEENMCVYARVRPMLPQEEAKGHKECISAIDDHTVRMVVPETSARFKNSRQCDQIVEDFTFTAAFGGESGQFVFFQDTMLNVIQNFVEGGNSLVFSYGITGSGKTYTLQGNAENPGIIPLSLKLYFGSIEKHLLQGIKVKPHMYNSIKALSFEEQKKEHNAKKELLSLYNEEYENAPGSFRISSSKTFAMTLCSFFYDSYEEEERTTTLSPEDMASAQSATLMKEVIRKSADSQPGVINVWISFVEIYNENIFDLLVPYNGHGKRKCLMLKEQNNSVYIDGAREICVSSGEEALKVLNIGRKNLSIASTKMNYQSSRSHCIYTLRVVRVRDANDLSTGIVNRLFFCDLAGSERVSKTQTTGVRLKEAGAINTSLLVLGRCLEQLRMNQSGRDKRIIPFRESKLTRIFSGFFLGQGSAVMIANASPSDYTFDETLHVLKFSAIARKLKVDETFFSGATTLLKQHVESICNQWSNASINESTDSIDSYELIKEKDEIIDKLVEVLKQLENKEREMAKKMEDMEYRIRQEIIREYSEYSDRLLEERRIMCEAQIQRLRNNYKKILEKRDKMYEDALAKYEDESATMDSEDDNLDDSSSQLDLDNGDGSSLKESKSYKELGVMTETVDNQKEEIEKLRSELDSVKHELEKARKELLDSQSSEAKLEGETDEKNKNDIKDLEEQISSLRNELSAAKENGQLKEFNALEMKSENEVLKTEMKTLQQKIEDYEKSNDAHSSEISSYKSKITDLENELLLHKKNHEEQIQASLDESSKLKKDAESIKKEIETLQNTVKNYELESENYQKQISALEKEKVSLEEQYKCKLEEKSVLVTGLERAKEKLSREINTLRERVEDNIKSSEEFHLEKINSGTKIADLENKLTQSEKKYEELVQNHLNESSELKKVNEQLTKEIEALKEQNKDLSEKCKETSESSKASSELSKDNELLKKEIESLKEQIKTFEGTVENYNVKSADYIKQISTLESELKSSAEQHKCQLQEKSTFASGLEKENNELKEEMKTLKDQITRDEKSSDRYCTEIDNYKSQVAELENKLLLKEKEYEEKMQNSLNICSELRKENEELKLEVETLKEQIKDYERSGDDYSSKIDSYESKITDLESKLVLNEKNYEEQVQMNLNESAELKKENESLKSEMKTLKDQIEHVEKSKEGYCSEISDCKSRIADLEDKLKLNEKNYEERIQASLDESSELRKENQEIRLEINTLKEQIEENEKNCNGYSSQISDYQSKIAGLEEELLLNEKKHKEQMQKNISVCSELKSDNEELQKEVKKWMEQNEVLLEKIESHGISTYESSNLKAEIEEHKILTNKLKEDNEKLQSEKEKLKEEFQRLQVEFKNLEESKDVADKDIELTEVKKENSDYKAKIDKLKDDYETLQKQTTKVEEEKCLLGTEFKKLEESASLMKQEIVEKEDKISKLEKEICDCKAKMGKMQKDYQALQKQTTEVHEEKSQFEMELRRLEAWACCVKQEIVDKDNKIIKLEKENCNNRVKIDKLQGDYETSLRQSTNEDEEKNQLKMKLKELEESASLTKQDIVEKEDKISKLEKENCDYKAKIDKLQEDCQALQKQTTKVDEEKSQLETELKKLEKSASLTKQEIMEKEDKISKLEKEKCDFKEKMDKLQEDYETLLKQNTKIEEEKCQLETELKKLEESASLTKQDIVDKKNKIEELEKGNDMLKKEAIVLKEKVKKHEEQISKYNSNIENHRNTIKDIEKKLLSKDEQLQAKSSAACELEKDTATLYSLVDVLEKCENKAYDRSKELCSSVSNCKSEIKDLYHKMRNKECSIEELEKGLFKSQEQLKEAQLSFEQKVMSIKEQHEIEISETMKVKHSVEEENKNLKKEISETRKAKHSDEEEIKNLKKEVSETKKAKLSIEEENENLKKQISEAVEVKSTIEEENENEEEDISEPKPEEKKTRGAGTTKIPSLKEKLPKNPSTRSLRNKRPTNFKDISLTSIESTSPEVKQKARKRISDEDFEVHETRASKKMKPAAAASKIPTTQRGKLAPGNDENMSPIQKFKNTVTSKVKNISSTISNQLSSPRVTRGKKKLFNPEVPSSSKTEIVTRGRKK